MRLLQSQFWTRNCDWSRRIRDFRMPQKAFWFCSDMRSLLFTIFVWLCLISAAFCFELCLRFRPLCIVHRRHILLLLIPVKQYKFEVGQAECPDFSRLTYCFARFWWRILLSCRLTRLNLNSVQFSIACKDGVLWRLRGRISSFWTSPGRFRRIIAMSKSGFGDVSTKTTPGVALSRGKPRRKYFSLLNLTRWTDHIQPKTCFILALYRVITSTGVLLKSQRLRGIFWMDSCPFSHQFELCGRVNNLRHRHISKTHRVFPACPEPGNVQGACIGRFLLVTR